MDIVRCAKLLLVMLLLSFSAKAQDTLSLNLHQADSIFLANSFQLLAASMNIEAEKAQILQAKLYPNPVFTVELGVYAGENNKAFPVGANGHRVFQLEQLIILGGKRKAEIDMAKTNAAIAELQFQQLTRNLKYQLHSRLFTAGQELFLLNKYNTQLALLDGLLLAYQTQVEKGNIPLKELVRLKGAYLKLNNDRADLLKDYFATQTILQKILQVSSIIKFEFSDDAIAQYIKSIPLQELTTTASTHRPDLQILQQNNTLTKQYLQFQKRVNVPDINVFGAYDQNSAVFREQVNAGISIPLPLWNHNQGNIRAARYQIQEAEYQLRNLQQELIAEVQNAYAFYSQTISEYQKATTLYNEDFEITITGMTDNFQKRNVSVIEFIDFFEAYNEVQTELSRIKTQLVTSAQELNLLTGKDIF